MSTDYSKIEYIQNEIKTLLSQAGFNPKVEYEQSLVKGLVFRIYANPPKMLIGRQGSTLNAIENLLFAIVNKKFREDSEPIRFSIDIDDYRANREYQLKQEVKEVVSKLKYSKEPITLPAMPRHERKFIHTYIQQQFPHLTTESVGEEPYRSIKIKI